MCLATVLGEMPKVKVRAIAPFDLPFTFIAKT